MSEFNKNHGWLARKGLAEQDWVFRHTGGYESAPTSNWFKDTWNSLRKSKWDEFGNRETINNSQSTSATTSNTISNTTNSNKVSDWQSNRFTNKPRREAAFVRNTLERAKNPKGASKPLKEGSSGNIVIDGKNIKFDYIKDQSGNL
jgi:hypothetical protein